MNPEDQFTSVRWDRDEINKNNNNQVESTEDQSKVIKPDIKTQSVDEEPIEEEYLSVPVTDANNAQKSNTIIQENTDEAESSDPSNSLLISQPDNKDEPSQQPKINEERRSSNSQPELQESLHESNSNEAEIPSQSNAEQIDTSFFDKYSIKISATNPNRDLDASSKPFISYLVTTTTDNPNIKKLGKDNHSDEQYVTYSVRRRYGDFRYLHESLTNDFPTTMIPPLPSKSNIKYLTGDTFSHEFVHKRLHSLERFLRFIVQHKLLSQSSIFHLFISDSNDWNTFTTSLKLKELNVNGEQQGGLVNKVVNEDLITEKVMNFLTSSKHKKETNREILEINDKLNKLYENLLKLDRIFSKLNRKNKELSNDYSHFSNQILKLSTIQSEEDSSVISNFKVFAESLDFFSNSWSQLHKYMDESFLVSLKDCSKYIISLTNLIELQHNKKIDLQVLQDYLIKTRNELSTASGGHPSSSYHSSGSGSGIVNNTTQLIKDTISTSATPYIGSTSKEHKIQKLENKAAQLENEIKVQTKLINDFTNKIITEEYPNWDNFNKNELKGSMIGLCDKQIEFYKGLVDKWTDVEIKLTQRLNSIQ
ncbi:SNX4 [Candida pseudojiufengensis]|uniref:SNX4 n=1 Tax=Candida pseudojiufengensis TaxID=497109 RepID=UPI00222539E0|nr:SNX4 [Candida pseudojiufengensis]KAI5960658.1 SNX4 [Candida pseudojiufengensis]